MKEKNNGDFLEIIVAQLEKSIANDSNIKIKRRYKILDRDGLSREIDIYVEFVQYKKMFKYAIECKDWKDGKPVDMKDISDFYDKIANHGMKGYFLTTGVFRKNAIEKAKNLNIDLLTISNVDENLIKEYFFVAKRYNLNKAVIYNPLIRKNEPIKKIYVGTADERKVWKFKDFMNKYIKCMFEVAIEQHFKECYQDFFKIEGTSLTFDIQKRERIILGGELNLVYFKENNNFYPLTHVQVDLDLWLELHNNKKPETLLYKSLSENNNIAKFVFEKINLDENNSAYISFVKIEGEENYQINYSTTNNPSEFLKNKEFEGMNKDVNLTRLTKEEANKMVKLGQIIHPDSF